MIIINICLLIVALILAKTILKRKKLILSYDTCLKKQGNMGRLMFLANYAKTCGHDMIIDYSTMKDICYVLFYKNGWEKGDFATYVKSINDDKTFEEAIKELERLIK
jgi:hypothetical protein